MMSDKRSLHTSEKGFTLLEMMVAITLVMMMAAGIWSVFRTSLRTWSRGTEYIDASQRQRNILDMVRKQLASAYPLTAQSDAAMAIMPSPIFQGTETSLLFVSLNSLRFQDSPGLTLVNYQVDQDVDGAYILQEREERFLGQIPDPESDTDAAGTKALFANLTQCYFEYRTSDENEDPWIREWNAEERGRLPEAIAVTLAGVDMDGNTRNHHIVVPIHATQGSSMMNIMNQAGIRTVRGGRMGGSVSARGAGGELDGNLQEMLRRRMERGAGRELNREYQDLLRRRLEGGRGPGRGPNREIDERLQEIIRRRLEEEQRR